MQYKTIILELLKQRPQVHEELRKSRKLLATVERYASELKTSYEAWTQTLTKAKPHSDPGQIKSEATEMALKAMEEHFESRSLPDQNEPPSLEGAMAFIRRHRAPR